MPSTGGDQECADKTGGHPGQHAEQQENATSPLKQNGGAQLKLSFNPGSGHCMTPSRPVSESVI